MKRILLILLLIFGCDIFSSNTACELKDISAVLGDLSGCYDDWDEDECAELSNTNFYTNMTCSDLGYTKKCPENPDTWVLESYPCDQ